MASANFERCRHKTHDAGYPPQTWNLNSEKVTILLPFFRRTARWQSCLLRPQQKKHLKLSALTCAGESATTLEGPPHPLSYCHDSCEQLKCHGHHAAVVEPWRGMSEVGRCGSCTLLYNSGFSSFQGPSTIPCLPPPPPHQTGSSRRRIEH